MEGSNPVPTYCAVRTDRYLYARYATGEQELYDLAFSGRQPGYLRRGRRSWMPLQKTVHNQIGNAGAEGGLVPFQSFHCNRQIVGSIGLEHPPTNTHFQTVLDHDLGVCVGEYQYSLGWIALHDLSCCIGAI
jgi:hypothetical protein